MEFWVKLLDVHETKDQDGRDWLQKNCTHVANNFWLFEGDAEVIDEGIDFHMLSEEAIEGYGDMSGSQLKALLKETFNVDKCFID